MCDYGIDATYAYLVYVQYAILTIQADGPEVFAVAVDGGFAAEDGAKKIIYLRRVSYVDLCFGFHAEKHTLSLQVLEDMSRIANTVLNRSKIVKKTLHTPVCAKHFVDLPYLAK
jgi:hypothetical protein